MRGDHSSFLVPLWRHLSICSCFNEECVKLARKNVSTIVFSRNSNNHSWVCLTFDQDLASPTCVNFNIRWNVILLPQKQNSLSDRGPFNDVATLDSVDSCEQKQRHGQHHEHSPEGGEFLCMGSYPSSEENPRSNTHNGEEDDGRRRSQPDPLITQGLPPFSPRLPRQVV